jgi:hypothetical protein
VGVMGVDGDSAEGATPGEGSVEVAPVDAAMADEAMGVDSPVSSPEEDLRGGTADSAVGMAGLGLALVSPIAPGPTGIMITRIRLTAALTTAPATVLTPPGTTAPTPTHPTRAHTIRVRTTVVRFPACVALREDMGEAAPFPAAAIGSISAGGEVGKEVVGG